MDILRIILIVFGLVLLVGIYFADRYKRRKERDVFEDASGESGFDTDGIPLQSFSTADDELPDEWVGKAVTITPRRHEPLADEQLDGLKGLGSRTGDEPVATIPPPPLQPPADVESEAAPEEVPPSAGEVIVLTVIAGEGRAFRGPLLLKALRELGLEHGEMNIFHYHLDGYREPLFSVADILEPGSFNLSEITGLETPGVAIFMQLPAVIEGERALAILLRKTRQMAALLSGTLCDEQRRPLDAPFLAALQARAHTHTTLA